MERNEQRLVFEERVDRYISNKLTQDQINDLWVEVIEDKRKYEYLKTTVALTRYFSDYNDASEDTSATAKQSLKNNDRVRKVRNIAAAAGITLAIGVGSVYMYSIDSQGPPAPLTSLDYAVLRAAGDTEERLTQVSLDIQSAITLAQGGEFDLAIHRLREIYDKPDLSNVVKSEVLINQGIIEYNSGDFFSSAQSFRRVIQDYPDDILLVERSTWYLAQSQLAAGDVASARETLQRVSDYGGAHSRAANRYLRYLR
ncbi:MAG: tetratricopeptide repeat protein [Bacteroidetes bacterium]|nr:tetratricopeptide repeat protein [Bacteroidota bacterium]MCH8523772.1 tetratricopeptide repeat protein [Balneolales bacterium]